AGSLISTPTSPSETLAADAARDAAEAAPEAGALPAAAAWGRGEIRTPFLSIEIVTSRPLVSFFSITIAGSFLLPTGLGGFGGLGFGGVTVISSEPIGRLKGGSFDRISALIRSSTESSAK